MKKKLTWLHLSDIHYGKPRREYDIKQVLRLLLKDIKLLIKKNSLEINLIFFTGDLAFGQHNYATFSNMDEQYSYIEEFFVELREVCNIEKQNFYIIPGNHDLNVSTVDPIYLKYRKDKKNGLDLNELSNYIIDGINDSSKVWENYINPLKEYNDFLIDNNYFHLIHSSKLGHFYTNFREINDFKFSITGFNTAWSSNGEGESERGNLIFGLNTQHQILNNNEVSVDFKIALLHHPIDWAHNTENGDLKKKLPFFYDFILHGHTHENWFNYNDECFTFEAGAAYPGSSEEDKHTGYNLVQINPNDNSLTYWLRKFDNNAEPGWVEHHILNKTNNYGIKHFEDVNFLQKLPVNRTTNTEENDSIFNKEFFSNNYLSIEDNTTYNIHSIFLDIVGFTKRSNKKQLKFILSEFYRLISKTLNSDKLWKTYKSIPKKEFLNQLIKIPKGDGITLIWQGNIENQFLIDFSVYFLDELNSYNIKEAKIYNDKLTSDEKRIALPEAYIENSDNYDNIIERQCVNHNIFRVRISISTGTGFRYTDINGKINFAGSSINHAGRINKINTRGMQIICNDQMFLDHDEDLNDSNLPGNIKPYSIIDKRTQKWKYIFQYVNDSKPHINSQPPLNAGEVAGVFGL